MVKVVWVIAGLLLLCSTALASDYSAQDAGADMVAKGFEKAFIAAPITCMLLTIITAQ
jgi:hypothetical protein